jgi:hypothetical protein
VLYTGCRALQQTEFEVGKASINATTANATPSGIEQNLLQNSPSDTATVVLLPQTPHLDMQLVTDVGWVDYAGARAPCETAVYTWASAQQYSISSNCSRTCLQRIKQMPRDRDPEAVRVPTGLLVVPQVMW